MKLVIVVPCYNEEEVLPETTAQLSRVLDGLRGKKAIDQGIILYVDDGSKDTTWRLVQKYATENPYVKGLKLAHNVGHQQALWAGLEWASQRADAAVSIDADLQDDVDAIGTMVDYYNRGVDIVYGVRRERKVDTFFKKGTALAFYRLMRNLGGEIVYNHADFRLMSKRAVEELSLYKESHLFLRGIVPELGFNTSRVYYSRKERLAGESKYPLKKMISFAFNGITSFSIKPLTLILYGGIISIFVSIIIIIYAIIQHFNGETIVGWTSLFASIWFIGGVQLVSLGIIGQYVGKNFIESKHRPRYYIEAYLNHDKDA